MKKTIIILSGIIVILLLTIIFLLNDRTKTIEGTILVVGSDYLLVSTDDNIDYIINTKNTNYTIGDKIKIEANHINKNKTPYEVKTKNISVITKNNKEEQKEETNKDEPKNENATSNDKPISGNNNQEIKYSDTDIINYFEDLKNKLTNYTSEHDISKEIKEKFVIGIDFLFYDKAIGGKTFKELTNTAKIKVLEIAMYIDSKIDTVFPGYKDSINQSYQNIKSKIITLYLDTTTTICNNDPNLCKTAKEGFQNLKENFGITWDLIKDLAGTGLTKLKDWYEIWRYN
jgi:hypothetical protein